MTAGQVVTQCVPVVQHAPIATNIQAPGIGIPEHGSTTGGQIWRRVQLVPQRSWKLQQVDVVALLHVLHDRATVHLFGWNWLIVVKLVLPPSDEIFAFHSVGEAVDELHPLV